MGRYQGSLDLNDETGEISDQQDIKVNCFGSMSYRSTKRSESSASRRSLDMDMDMDDLGDDRDESKRKSRNLSEKKRRDQFNILINELCSMVSNSPRKMDKSTVLKATIAFLKTHNELSVQSQVQETQEDWKPSFLSNEEFTHLMMESLDGFILVISCTGQILYLSESVTSLLGHLSSDLVNCSIFDYVSEDEKTELHNVLYNPVEDKGKSNVSMILNFRVGGFGVNEENFKYQLIKVVGYFKRWISPDCGSETNTEKSEGEFSESNDSSGTNHVFISTGRVIDADLLREMSVVIDTAKNEFSSRHSLEWKFLFLDHRAPPIIGYLPFEVLGTSGYDYYHAEDLEKVANCHEALMQKGEGTSCFYRFLTKGQQWIWLQTRFYITYHQWNSKPEFIMCTHRVVGYADVMKDIRGESQSSQYPNNHGQSLAKQPKLENEKSSEEGSLKISKKNGGMSYGCVGSKRGFMRKLDLPPKFASGLPTSHSAMLQPQEAKTQVKVSSVHTTNCTQSIQQPQTFHPSPEDHSTETPGAPVASSSQGILQEQLLMKHAELQRQIMQQQEELRRVSEQLLMSQCGFITEGDRPHVTPHSDQPSSPTTKSSEESNAAHLQQVQ